MSTITGTSAIEAARKLSSLISGKLEEPIQAKDDEGQEDQAEGQEAEPVEASEAETPDGDKTPSETKHKVQVDGVEIEVSLEELRKGYMMEANYRNKTAALSRERETVEAKGKQVDQMIEDARALVEEKQKELTSEELLELKTYDPEAYIKRVEKIQADQKKLNDLLDKRKREQAERERKLLEKEQAAILDAFPEWSDKKVMQEQFGELMDVLKSFGYSDAELSSLVDHRIFVLAQKAKLLEKLSQVKLDDKIVQAKPKALKPGSNQESSNDLKKIRDKFFKTGSKHDAMKLLSTR
jgi:hypothetical protein